MKRRAKTLSGPQSFENGLGPVLASLMRDRNNNVSNCLSRFFVPLVASQL